MPKFFSALAVAALISGPVFAHDERDEKPIDCTILKEGSKERADCESKQRTDARR